MKFRQYKTSSEKLIFLGKSAESNESLVEQAQENEFLLHTEKPGSPFTNIKADSLEVSKADLKEAAIFCAKHSQDWRDNKKDVLVHVFLKKNTYKNKKMKLGTFGVKDYKEIKVKKKEIRALENEK